MESLLLPLQLVSRLIIYLVFLLFLFFRLSCSWLSGIFFVPIIKGGKNNKSDGRIGDSPVIGCGTWADNETCGVSGTGEGEVTILNVLLISYETVTVLVAVLIL